ncbi:MAG: sialate O-acetylesterase [Clostridium sp.]|nr:sialate O-acetylesterase [Bacteroides sp.]MCM1199297.1 sialate O-acetylesterase [Clostridium sp.]
MEAKVWLPEILGDNMVLQQNTDVKIWGKAVPGGDVTVVPSWSKQKFRTKAGSDGCWEMSVCTPRASYDSQSITISDKESAIVLSDVLIGEVWYCSGQSNMEMPLGGFWNCPVEDANRTIATAGRYKGIRCVTIPKTAALSPKDDVSAKWMKSTIENAPGFSATAYFFAQMLSDALDVPVGIIVCSWGGSKVEGWLPESIVRGYGEFDFEKEYSQNVEYDWQWHYYTPSIMYNAMYHPIRKYTVKGFLWYQGESNVGRHDDYTERFSTMVDVWRKNQGGEEKPVFLVELAPWQYGDDISGAKFREMQHRIPSAVNNCGVVCTNDLVYPDEITQIHPRMKKPVGERLAYLALNKAYGYTSVGCEGPSFRSMEVDGNSIELSFNNASDGLSPWNGLTGFEIAGEDRVFHPATARLNTDRKTIIVSSPEVPAPVAVRYCFHDFQTGNVVNMHSLPLVPFRTDCW